MKIRPSVFLYIIILFSSFMLVNTVSARQERGAEFSFQKGNIYYEEGKYDTAIKEYSQLLEQGLESGNLYFNLGNSYFKKGELGKAILNYERARRLIPRDGDLKTNYQFAVSKIAYNTSEGPSWFKERFNMVTLNEVTIILSCFFISILLFLMVSIFVIRIRRYSYIVLGVSLIVFMTFAYSMYSKVSVLDSEAVIISQSAEAKYEPADSATTHFSLYEGMKVYVLELKKEWVKVKRPDGKIGWIRTIEMEKI
ncbi:MAG: tetratricopeptide repeat protein [Nitrospirae bacterium]|nr:tetratricopeptide repeat protein [Nitrospirota bacterium]